MSIDRPKDDLVCQGEGSEAYSFAIWYVDINGGGGGPPGAHGIPLNFQFHNS